MFSRKYCKTPVRWITEGKQIEHVNSWMFNFKLLPAGQFRQECCLKAPLLYFKFIVKFINQFKNNYGPSPIELFEYVLASINCASLRKFLA